RVAPQVPGLRHRRDLRRLLGRAVGLLQRLRQPGRRPARHVGRGAPHGRARRPGHAARPGGGRRPHRVSQELRERVHQALAADPRRRVHRRPLRAARPGGRLPQEVFMSRRTIALFALAAFLLALVAGLGTPTARAQSGPIKIGFLSPLTGAASALGKDMLNGTELYLDEIGRTVAGRKIELIVEDTEGNTQTALTKARKLVDQDHIHILSGGLPAATVYASHPFAEAQKIPTTYPVMSSDDLTQRKPAKWVVRTGWNSSQSTHALGDWVIKNTRYRKIATVAADYAFGWESVGGFQRTFAEGG